MARAIQNLIIGTSLFFTLAAWPMERCGPTYAPIRSGGPTPATYDAETGIFGVSKAQLEEVVKVIQKRLGPDVIEVFAIGSRASGHRSPGKGSPVPHLESDLDLLIHLKRTPSLHLQYEGLINEMKSLDVPFRCELHIISSEGGRPYQGIAVAYPAGDPAYYPIVDVATEPDPHKRQPAVAIPIPLSSPQAR
jgi:hypothetical protein